MSRILYIGGCTRSGSTLVDRMLGQLPGFVSTGEFGLITTHSITENRLCGCGRRFRDCPYWTAVGEKAFGGWDGPDAAELVKLHPQVTRQRYIPLLIFPSLSPGFARKLRRYQSLLGRLYAAVSAVSGADIVVNSTKAPAYALALRGIPDVDLRIFDLVRDSRGTAYSSSKEQVMKDSVDRVVRKHRYAAPIITARWIVYHLIFDCIRIAGIPGHHGALRGRRAVPAHAAPTDRHVRRQARGRARSRLHHTADGAHARGPHCGGQQLASRPGHHHAP